MTASDLEKIAAEAREADDKFKHQFRVCTAASCLSSQSDQVKVALEAELKTQNLEGQCGVKAVGCLGLCSAGPLVALEPDGLLYQAVMPEDAVNLISSLAGQPLERLRCNTDQPFFKRQHRIVTENCGRIDPERIAEYVLEGGYSAILKAVNTMTPQAVIEEVVRSGLRGRGGAGYPTGLKWSTVAKASGERKFVICNADEGDPGAYMDRSVLESDPHRVIEGMILAGYAVGASSGFIYVRAEYPLAVERLKTAIRQAERLNLLGNNICGTPFNFKLEIRLGAGAFVCGEETALIASIEGGRGTPHPRPPYPAEHGLWGMPTLINNVETFANIAPILRHGGAWFAGIGTPRSKGTKVFALAGQVEHSGLIEVPMGTSLQEIILEIGGNDPEHFKAVQTGGPSGGCIPKDHLETPVDYESLVGLGTFMGSGGMIVVDQGACMVALAKYFMEFCMTESCGKCIPCRVGTVQMHAILEKITLGEAQMQDLELLEELCDLVRHTSLCGLGQGAPNPVLSTLRYFRDEYIAHILEKRCPAGVCKILDQSSSSQGHLEVSL
jgi:bidirectional [NiFe] hydrogenase diaphorase subunit